MEQGRIVLGLDPEHDFNTASRGPAPIPPGDRSADCESRFRGLVRKPLSRRCIEVEPVRVVAAPAQRRLDLSNFEVNGGRRDDVCISARGVEHEGKSRWS